MKPVLRVVFAAAIAALTLTHSAYAQDATQQATPPPAPTPAAKPAPPVLSNIAPQISNLNPFPPADPKNFTATFPTKETVNAFLQQLWGYDPNRIFQVAAIVPTTAPTVSQVVVFVAQRGQPADQTKTTTFLVLNDGKHGIAGDNVIDFGATPFADKRALLQARADGPARGSADKKLELVEFADLQCPHCKDAQATMDQLAKDFPSAHIVFQNYPLTAIHPSAFLASAYGLCVAQQKPDNNNEAFFAYVHAVFDTQDALTGDNVKQTLDNAVVKAGLDASKIAACADTQPIKDNLKASIKLAKDAQVESTPLLMVNGRAMPLAGIAYDTLKSVILYQAQLDGITLAVPPTATSAAK
ncbi:MAG TPA: thioredoxin domain-containing protein [Acidobacteriaceae bacterium]